MAIHVGNSDIFVVTDMCGTLYGVRQPAQSTFVGYEGSAAAPAQLDLMWIQGMVQGGGRPPYGSMFTSNYLPAPGLVAVDSSVNPPGASRAGSSMRGADAKATLGNDQQTLLAFIAVEDSMIEPMYSDLQGLAILIPNAGLTANPPEITSDIRARVRSVVFDPAIPPTPTGDDNLYPVSAPAAPKE